MSDNDYIPAGERHTEFNDGSMSMLAYLAGRCERVLDSHMVADSVACELAAALRELCDIYPDGMDDATAALARFDATIGQTGAGDE